MKSFHLNRWFVCPVSSFDCPGPGDSWIGGYFARGSFADDIHVGCLKDPERFINACANDFFHRLVRLRQRISVNMFAGRIALIKKVFSTFLDHHCCDDEGYIGKLPSLTHMDHVIDTHFTVVHFAFNPQYKTDKGKDLSRLIAHYDELSLQLTEAEKENVVAKSKPTLEAAIS